MDDALHQLREQLSRAANQPHAEFDVAVYIGRFINPQQDDAQVRRRFDLLLAPLLQESGSSVDAVLDWFKSAGFGQRHFSEVSANHSNIQWVMEQREGIPITLAVLIMSAARQCGLDSFGVNYPGHYLLRIEEHLIDPLNGERVAAHDLDDSNGLIPSSVSMLALRMLNNVKMVYMRDYEWQIVLDVVDLQLALTADDQQTQSALWFEQGQYWQQLGGLDSARSAYERCLSLSDDKTLRAQAEQRLAALPLNTLVWH